jgi:thiamine biosynthesis lipoprotein ApbE
MTIRGVGVPVNFPALGTTAVVVIADPDADAEAAVRAVESQISGVDAACSRFRDDSELSQLNAAGGATMAASPVLLDALEVAIRAAGLTDGLVDPSVGSAMRVLGYDRDFAQVAASGPPLQVKMGAVPGWQGITIDRSAGTVRVPVGVALDLGATAKAWCADRAARAAACAARSGVLVSLGGDVAVSGRPPPGGWRVRVTDHHRAGDDAPGQTVAISVGGLATSGTTARRWRRGGQDLHHIIDPATGQSATGPWRTVSVAAGTCVDANTASTAAIILGEGATAWLEERRLAARLVGVQGAVVYTAGWPVEQDS